MEYKEKKKWTLMFFFASDNNLTSSMLYQLKAIKTAGYQLETNVLVHFDPHERGVPSMIFEVNKTEKAGQTESKIGDDENPTVHDLFGDQIEPAITPGQTRRTYSADYDQRSAGQALTHFLEVSRKDYPAEKYMLFLVGHGLVVGGDAFLPDENPQSGISLVDLGRILRDFHDEIDKDGEVLELIGMHSCSMSAVEVAYQLKGWASYMLGSEGMSFVGAWPYRQMLQKIFYAIEQRKSGTIEVPELMKSLHELCLHNSADLIFAGYSSDLCLVSLDPKRVEALTGPIEKLTEALLAGLNDDRGKELILLAHWKSQSYYQELYTDLFDFCLCLGESCSESDSNRVQKAMKLACESVIEVLTPETIGEKSVGPIVQADFCGPDCQYSYGLSIYFPWTRPYEDAREHVIRNYQSYAFVTSLCGASWLKFLEAYFEKTMRPGREIVADNESADDVQETLRALRSGYIPIPVQSSSYETALTRSGKVSPADASGFYSYTFIKNYPRDLSMTARAMKVFRR
ncbi:MAG TPA: clostripain-related cysteine peptidase [Pyrinomonadaceae bacterium]|nr:clostripain-related cysteine peptidase [Pyrinomonadaceae bacterium]